MKIRRNSTLTIAANDHYAFQFVKESSDSSKLSYVGRDFEVLKVLSDKMAFEYEIVTAADGQWGVCSDEGNCTGLIGMVSRKEADLAISTVANTAQRAKFVHFSDSYLQDEVTIVTAKPGKYKLSHAFLAMPMEPKVWLCNLIILCLFILAVKCLKWRKIQIVFDIWNVIKIALSQGDFIDRKKVGRISVVLSLTLTLFCGSLSTLYESYLTANTSHAPLSQPIDTLLDMVKAIRTRKYVISGVRGTSDQEALLSSRAETLVIFAQTTKRNGFEAPASLDEAVSRVLNDKFALIWPKTWLKKDLLDKRIPLNLFHYASESLFSIHFSVVFNRQFPRKDELNKWLKFLSSSGLLKKWEFDKQIEEAGELVEEDPYFITFVDLKLLLLVMIFSWTVAVNLCAVEMFVDVMRPIKRNKFKRRKRPIFLD